MVKTIKGGTGATPSVASWTLKDLERSLARRQMLEIDLDEEIIQMEAELSLVRDRHGQDIASLQVQIQGEAKLQLAWMKEHKADFEGPPRSIEFATGTVGYRRGQPKLEPISKWTWEKVLLRILELGNEDLVRRTPVVDREMIMANKDVLGEDGLKAIGLKIAQDDKPFVEIKRDKDAAEMGEVAS